MACSRAGYARREGLSRWPKRNSRAITKRREISSWTPIWSTLIEKVIITWRSKSNWRDPSKKRSTGGPSSARETWTNKTFPTSDLEPHLELSLRTLHPSPKTLTALLSMPFRKHSSNNRLSRIPKRKARVNRPNQSVDHQLARRKLEVDSLINPSCPKSSSTRNSQTWKRIYSKLKRSITRRSRTQLKVRCKAWCSTLSLSISMNNLGISSKMSSCCARRAWTMRWWYLSNVRCLKKMKRHHRFRARKMMRML